MAIPFVEAEIVTLRDQENTRKPTDRARSIRPGLCIVSHGGLVYLCARLLGGIVMRKVGGAVWLCVGLILGGAVTYMFQRPSQPVFAANDRHEDYILCTGQMALGVNIQADCVWLLDYRAGKLLGTIVDKNFGKVVGWADVDLVQEFGIAPKQNVHFMMTTGSLMKGQTALYLTEVTSGKFGIYTIAPVADGTGRMRIIRHDAAMFRPPPAHP
jgi:hypothetical protein